MDNDAISRVADALGSNGELRQRAMEAWKEGADASAIVRIASEAGVELAEADVEATLAELKAREASAIAGDPDELVDEGELARVAGGAGSRVDCCTEDFFEQQCQATVEDGSWCKSNDMCVMYSESYRRICTKGGITGMPGGY